MQTRPTLLQLPLDSASPEAASVVFSGPPLLIALLAGVVMAIGFQLLFTNLSLAYLIAPSGVSKLMAEDVEDTESLTDAARNLEAKAGLWTLLTVSLALFIACFLAVKLSLVSNIFLGIILGIVIWSAFFSLLVWKGSSLAGSFLGSLLSTATSGLQGLFGTATSALGATVAQKQVVSTAEEITAAVRRELTSGLNPDALQKALQQSLTQLPLSKLDPDQIREQFAKILKNTNLKDILDSDLLQNINRQTFVDLISDRTALSKDEINQVAGELEKVWQQLRQKPSATLQDQVRRIFQAAVPAELQSGQLVSQLEQLISERTGQTQPKLSLSDRALALGFDLLSGIAQGKVDLSQVDVNQVAEQVEQFTQKITAQTERFSQSTFSVTNGANGANGANGLKKDVDDYILHAMPWQLNGLSVIDDFQNVLYSPVATSTTARQQLAQLNQDYFRQLILQRGDMSPHQVEDSAELMEEVRRQVLERVVQTEEKLQTGDLQNRLSQYLRSLDQSALDESNLEQTLQNLLSDPEAGSAELQQRFEGVNRDTLFGILREGQNFGEDAANRIVERFEQVRDRVLQNAQTLQEDAQNRATELRHEVEAYLRDTNREELNPDAIERELRLLFTDPQAGAAALRSRLGQFDRETLVQLLSQRQDLSEEQVNQILDRIESVRDSIIQAPQQLSEQAKAQYEQTTQAIAQYLRDTNLEELNPDGIREDLTKLFQDPQAGASALRERLAQVDRETLVKLLSQREDISEEQVNQAIDKIQAAIQQIREVPQQLVSQVQNRVMDFESNLEQYLRNTRKEELNPDGIKRDLKLLLTDPRLGVDSLSDRVAKFDRSTLVALLAQRDDLTEAEANEIVDRILSTRDLLVEQVQQLQQRVQSVVDDIFAQLRSYLNSLERPELNYDNIKQDFITLFDDPQLGLEALRDRLSHFDRETLVALLSSRSDISEADANRIIDQVESARDTVLNRAEQVQQEVQKRIAKVQNQTKRQFLETRKVAADAAWWLFNTAFTSLAASAIAGAIAVGLKFNFG